jgi:pimeloyl-ACP methyl ester carboxylesterase
MTAIAGPGVRALRAVSAGVVLLFTFSACAGAPQEAPAEAGTLEHRTFLRGHSPYDNSEFAVVDNVVLHYRTWQPETIPRVTLQPALLVHGLGASTYSFHEIAPWLAEQGFFVVAVDMPPFGYSDRRRAAVDRDIVPLLLAFLDELEAAGVPEGPLRLRGGAEGAWTLMGHSLGGRVVAGMAIAAPDRVASVVIFNGAIQFSEEELDLPYDSGGAVSRILGTGFRALETPQAMERILHSAYGRMPLPGEIEGYRRPFTVAGTIPAVVRFVSAPVEAIGRLDELSAPTLAIWGSSDSWVPLRLGYAAVGRIPEVTLVVVPGAYHVPMETHPTAVRRALGLFLR